MKPLSRRTVLRGASGAAFSLPLLQAMLGRGARAQSAKPPRRIVFILTPGGFVLNRWKCAIPGTQARSFTLSPVLSEFSALRQKSLFIEGVPLTSAKDTRTCAAGHPQGTSAVFTGAFAGPGSNYGGNQTCTVGPPEYESVDQLLARTVGQQTRFPAVYVGAHSLGDSVAKRVFYGRNQTVMALQQNPAGLYKTLFSNFTNTAQVEAQRRLEERQFALGQVVEQYKSLRCQVGSADRQRLDQHMEELSALSKRLGLTGASGGACKEPAAPSSSTSTFSTLPSVVASQVDLIAMALACDLTRVVGFNIHAPDMDGSGVYSWLGHDRIWHQITHLEGPTPEDNIEKTNRWYAQQVLALASKLNGMLEADGSTVLDNTAIVWVSEVSQGWTHSSTDMPWAIIGGGQGYFDTGKYIKFANTQNERHNRLLVHFLHYMGVEATGFGHPDYQGSPLAGIRI